VVIAAALAVKFEYRLLLRWRAARRDQRKLPNPDQVAVYNSRMHGARKPLADLTVQSLIIELTERFERDITFVIDGRHPAETGKNAAAARHRGDTGTGNHFVLDEQFCAKGRYGYQQEQNRQRKLQKNLLKTSVFQQ